MDEFEYLISFILIMIGIIIGLIIVGIFGV